MKTYFFFFLLPAFLGIMTMCFYGLITAAHDAYDRNMTECVNKDRNAYPKDTEEQARFKCEYLIRIR